MDSENVPVFRNAVAWPAATRQVSRLAGLDPGGPGKTVATTASTFDGADPVDLNSGAHRSEEDDADDGAMECRTCH